MIIPIPSLDKWKLGAGTRLTKLPDGTVAIDALGSNFFIDLGITPKQVQSDLDGVYQLTFSIANNFPAYPGQYDVAISYGAQQLGECYGWGAAAFNGVSVNFPSPHYLILYHSLPGGGPPQGQSNLVIKGAESGGWQLLFKDFSLTFTPTN